LLRTEFSGNLVIKIEKHPEIMIAVRENQVTVDIPDIKTAVGLTSWIKNDWQGFMMGMSNLLDYFNLNLQIKVSGKKIVEMGKGDENHPLLKQLGVGPIKLKPLQALLALVNPKKS
jgi:hypothetical protein